jgi:putative NADH-flavin reductase
MKVLVLGASGRTGRLALDALARRGHTPVAFVRRAVEGFEGPVVHGSPADVSALRPALEGVDAVFGCLGYAGSAQICLPTTLALISLAPTGLRYIVIGGAAVDAPGDQKGLADRIVSGVARLVAGKMVAERQQELDVLQASSLAYTFLRPPQLVDRPSLGAYQFSTDTPAHFRIARQDLAMAMVDTLESRQLERSAPFVSWPKGGKAAAGTP